MPTAAKLLILSAATVALAACASSQPASDGVDVSAPSASAPTAHDLRSAEVATPSPSAVAPDGDACLMLYECGCNSGCVTVDKPRRGLHQGDLVQVKTGGLKGKDVFVAKNKTATGEEIFTVQQRDPKDEIQVCRRLAPDLLGYLCSTTGLGPPHGCLTCADE